MVKSSCGRLEPVCSTPLAAGHGLEQPTPTLQQRVINVEGQRLHLYLEQLQMGRDSEAASDNASNVFNPDVAPRKATS